MFQINPESKLGRLPGWRIRPNKHVYLQLTVTIIQNCHFDIYLN